MNLQKDINVSCGKLFSRFASLLLGVTVFFNIGGAGATEIPNPKIRFLTYWGTRSANSRTLAVDRTGNIYMSGGSKERDWPSTDGSKHSGKSDVTIAKFSPEGKLLWATILGGPSEDYAYVSAVNAMGELYVGGRAGEGFPTTEGAFDRTFNGGLGRGPHAPTDAFVAKLSPDGKLIYSTYIGGSADENARAIHLMPDGHVIVGGGNTMSEDLPTGKGTLPGPVLKPRKGGHKDAWIAMVAADGGSLEFLTYFGPNDDKGRGDETIRGLGVDDNGDIWIGGTTYGTDMQPTADAFQKTRGLSSDAFIAKISPDGKSLKYFSWLGGNGPDQIETESVSDSAGNFYVAGSTGSTDMPVTPGAFQSSLKVGDPSGLLDRIRSGFREKRTQERVDIDGWVAKINHDGTLGFLTLYGGSRTGPEAFFGPVVDAAGLVYVTGRFRSSDLVLTENAFQSKQPTVGGIGPSAAMVVFSPDGKQLLYGTYIGGSNIDMSRHLAISPDGKNLYVSGETRSTDIPIVNAFQKKPGATFLAGFTLYPE